MLTQEFLQGKFIYDQNTGVLTRKSFRDARGWLRKEQVAGWVRKDGYVHVQIEESHYYAHCIIWCLMTGVWPAHQIDHRDLSKANNRWVNLRPATPSQNKANILPRNALNAKGVRLLPSGRYWARIGFRGKRIQLGLFNSLEEAKAAYHAAAVKHFGEYARP